VGEYPEPALRLRFPAADARAFGDLFARRGKGLYRAVEPNVLTDGKAGKEAIRAALRAVAAKAEAQDVLVVTLSGHGVLNGQRYYFLPGDYARGGLTQDEAVRRHGLPDDELAELVKATKRVLVLDTCNSGGAERLFAMKGKSPDDLRGVIDRLNRNHGVAVIAAAPAGEQAREVDELGHGVLSYALLSGMRAVDHGPLRDDGLSPGAGGSVADVQEWFTHAEGRARRLMKKYYNLEQDLRLQLPETGYPILPVRD
jgi:uncharacterized caspase-like protein